MASTHHGDAADDERSEVRTDTAESDNGCEIRERPPRRSPGVLSEGAEGSLRGRQSRKRLQHDRDEEYDSDSPCERASRSRNLVKYDYYSRRRRSRSISVRDYRGAGPSKGDGDDRKPLSERASRSRDLIRNDRFSRSQRPRSISVRDYRGERPRERKRRYEYSSSSDDDHHVTFKGGRVHSLSPRVKPVRGSTKLRRKYNTVFDRLPKTDENIITTFLDILTDMKGT